jgi:phosphonoacetaldehyde hydrolase
MGLEKRDHLRALFRLPEVTRQWEQVHHRPWSEEDVGRLFQHDFVPLQLECVAGHSRLIDGLLDTVAWLRQHEIKIGTTTGFFPEAAERCWAAAREQGYAPDKNLSPGDVPQGRPAPWMIFRLMEHFGVYPSAAVIKVGDTLPDIAEGLSAGVWTVAVSRTGSDVGLTEPQWQALTESEQEKRLLPVRSRFLGAGAHYVIDSIADLPDVVCQIEERVAEGERP